jgi:hypothetical protein
MEEQQPETERSTYAEVQAEETAEAETEPIIEQAKDIPQVVRIRYPKLPPLMIKTALEIVKKGDIDALKLEHQTLLP